VETPGKPLLGFPGALAIRNFRVAHDAGAVDVVLIPQDGPIRLALVETKSARAADEACKVVGAQLLAYYAGALTFGLDGLNMLREFASKFPNLTLTKERTAPQKLVCNVRGVKAIDYPNNDCFELLTKGARVRPNDIALFVALDDKPHHVLVALLQMLRDTHSLRIGLVVAKEGTLETML